MTLDTLKHAQLSSARLDPVLAPLQTLAQKSPADNTKPAPKRDRTEEEPGFRSIGDELQTDATFNYDIIERIGARFYDEVFVPAVAEARAEGNSCQTVRDTIRRG
jgi:hypothetical protein